MKPNDLESAMEELRRHKQEINTLIDERNFFKISSDKYQRRAIYCRKKYTEIKQMRGTACEGGRGDAQLRLKCTEMKEALKQKQKELTDLRTDLGNFKSKLATSKQSSAQYRQEAQEKTKQNEKLSFKVLNLEKEKKQLL